MKSKQKIKAKQATTNVTESYENGVRASPQLGDRTDKGEGPESRPRQGAYLSVWEEPTDEVLN